MTANGSHIHQPPRPEITRLSRRREISNRPSTEATHFRAAATRHDRRGHVCLGTVIAAALFVRLRS